MEGGFRQLQTDEQDEDGDGQAAEIFHSGMTVGVAFVGGLFGQLEAEQGDHRTGGVGEVVYGVGGDGDAARDQAGNQFGGKEQDVADDTDDAGQFSVGGAHGGIVVVLVVLDKQARQELSHNGYPLYS